MVKFVLFLKISTEIIEGKISGYVITFDDITELLSAQKKLLGQILHKELLMK